MVIKELTPPVERRFSIELSENELKVLGVIMGEMDIYTLEEYIKNSEFPFNSGSIDHSDFNSLGMYQDIKSFFKS